MLFYAALLGVLAAAAIGSVFLAFANLVVAGIALYEQHSED